MSKLHFIFLFVIILLFSCKEKSYIYEVNEVTVSNSSSSSSNAKTKEKRPEQFIAVLYSNIFKKPISPNHLVDLTELIQSIGDQQVAFETIISQFLCDEDAQIPSNAEMRNNIPAFVNATYKRFYVREPTNAERAYFVNFIESYPNLTPINIYFSFAISNEYYFY